MHNINHPLIFFVVIISHHVRIGICFVSGLTTILFNFHSLEDTWTPHGQADIEHNSNTAAGQQMGIHRSMYEKEKQYKTMWHTKIDDKTASP